MERYIHIQHCFNSLMHACLFTLHTTSGLLLGFRYLMILEKSGNALSKLEHIVLSQN